MVTVRSLKHIERSTHIEAGREGLFNFINSIPLNIAARRRVVAYNEARPKIEQPVLLSIDLSEIEFK